MVGQNVNYRGELIGKPSIRTCKMRPSLDANEVPILLNLEIPDYLFKRPVLVASVIVPEHEQQLAVSSEVISTIESSIKDATGIVVRLEVSA
jgi:hypothetical protein